MADLTDMEVIFPHYVNYMEQFEDTRGKRRTLYLNHDGTGEYVWKKDELIDLTFPQVLDKMVECFPDQYCFKYTTLDYTRTYEEFRDDVDTFARALVSMGVKPGSKVAMWATNVPAVVHRLLGRHEDRRRAGYGEHRLQDPRGRVPAAPVRHAHAGHDRQRAWTPTMPQIINELCPEIAETKPGEQLHCKRLPFLRNVITVGFEMPGCLTFEQAMERCRAGAA